jgi:hypothetical protein
MRPAAFTCLLLLGICITATVQAQCECPGGCHFGWTDGLAACNCWCNWNLKGRDGRCIHLASGMFSKGQCMFCPGPGPTSAHQTGELLSSRPRIAERGFEYDEVFQNMNMSSAIVTVIHLGEIVSTSAFKTPKPLQPVTASIASTPVSSVNSNAKPSLLNAENAKDSNTNIAVQEDGSSDKEGETVEDKAPKPPKPTPPPTFTFRKCYCSDGDCRYRYKGTNEQCVAWCRSQYKDRFLPPGEMTISWLQDGTWSIGGCVCCGQVDPCKPF